MTQHGAAYEGGKYRVYRVVNGRYRLFVGPKFDNPRDAAQYARTLDDVPETSPLRDPVEPLTVPVVGGSTGLLRGKPAGQRTTGQ